MLQVRTQPYLEPCVEGSVLLKVSVSPRQSLSLFISGPFLRQNAMYLHNRLKLYFFRISDVSLGEIESSRKL